MTRGDKKGGDLFMSAFLSLFYDARRADARSLTPPSATGYGVMGGYMQPQGHVQILLNMLHHNLNPQSTLDAPRFCISADVPTEKEEGDIGTLVYLEDGVKEDVVQGLREMGHRVEVLGGHERAQFGRGQVSFHFLSPLFFCTSGAAVRTSQRMRPRADLAAP